MTDEPLTTKEQAMIAAAWEKHKAAAPRAAGAQRLVIPDWHPATSPNSQRRHWRDVQRRHHADADMAWASAKHAGWMLVQGRVRLTIVLVYPRKYRLDADNLVAKCKGLIDGLRHQHTGAGPGIALTYVHQRGFFEDDNTDVLELVVRAEVRPGVKQTELLLEPAPASEAGGA